MTPFKVSCEHCEASFRINDPARIGKRVKCPRCGEAFTVRKPAEHEEDNIEEEFDDVPAKPMRRLPGRPTVRKSRQAEKSEGPPVALLAGGGAGLLILLVGVLWMAGVFGGGAVAPTTVAPPAAPPSRTGPDIAAILDRLPPATEMVLHFRIKEALAAPLVAALRNPEFDAQLSQPNPLIPGTTLSGIETITVALSHVTLQLSEQKRLAAAGSASPNLQPVSEPLILVTLNDPLTPDFLNLPPESAVRHGSTTIYRVPPRTPLGAPPCLAIIEPKIVALGTEPQLKALVDQPSGNGPTADFQLLDGTSQVAMAICPRNIVQQIERLAVNSVEVPELHRELHQFVSKGGRTAAFRLALSTDLEAGFSVLATDANRLPDLQAILDSRVQMARDGMNNPQLTANPLLAGLKPIVDGIKVAATGDRLSASAVVPNDVLTGAVQMATAQMSGMMFNMGAPSEVPAASPASAP